MFKRLEVPWLWAAAVLAVSCSDDSSNPGSTEPEPVRGELLSLTPLGSLTASEVASYVAGFDLDTAGVRFGIDAYRVEYRTVDPNGALVRASSLIALPNDAEPVLEQAVWMHGTTVYRREAASLNEDSSDRAATFYFAAAGYATTAPDYLGLGLGEGPHPYDHIPSEVTAGIDALRATKTAAAGLERRLGSTLSLSGHSQGGPAAVALAHEVQDGGPEGLVLASVAPISGPYDMTGSLAIASRSGIAYAAAYLGYLTVAWNRWLGLYDAPSDAFLPPFDASVESLFDGDHTTEEVFSGLPETLEELITAAFLEQLREPSGALREALAEASRVCSWRPEVPVTVYASSGDADVPIDNARHCLESFRTSGAEVTLIDLGDADHSESMSRSLPLVLEQFRAADPLRR
jgi:pimeloyl-ACP methyl ester carboxylesterase